MAEVASAYVSLMPSAKNFQSELEGQIGAPVKKTGSKMGGFLGASLKTGALGLAAGAGTAIGTALFSGFKRLNAIDQAKAKLTGLGHSAQGVDKIMTNALASVKGTAFGLDEAATTAASVVAAGIKPGRQLQGVLKTVADTATIAGTSMADMGTIFGSVAARGKLQGDDLLQLQSRGVPVLAFLAKHYGITAAAASQMVSKGEVDFKNFAAAMHENLGGAALDSGKTFSGAFANLKASLSRIGANLLSGIFPAVKRGMAQLTVILSGLEPVAAKVGAAIGDGLASIGPVISKVSTALQALFAGGGAGSGFLSTLKSTFAQVAPAVASVGQSIATNFLPIMQQAGAFITGQVIPAISTLASYLVSQLAPIFTQVGQIISTQVVPIIASLAQFLYSTLYPAVVQIVTAIAQQLKPVFDALVQTFRANILPTLQQLLAKFHEWQPTIEQVVGVIVKITGKLLEFAAAILAKVLPPAIKLAGWLISTLVPAIADVIGVVIKVIGHIIDFGSKMLDAGKKAGQFVTKVLDELGKLPGKVADFFKDVGKWLYDAGRKLIGGLIDGIKSKVGDIGSAMGGIASKIKGFLPGSPVKEGPLTSWNNGGAGKRLMELLADGIRKNTSKIKDAMKDVADAIKQKVEDAKSALADLKSQAADLKASVQSAILDTGNLTSFTGLTGADGNQVAVTFQDIVKGLVDANDQATKFQQTIAQLSKLGLNKVGLDQLIAAGPSALASAQAILGAGAAGVKQVNALQASLGKTGGLVGDIAVKTDLGPAMAEATKHLTNVEHLQTQVVQVLKSVDSKLDSLPKKIQDATKKAS